MFNSQLWGDEIVYVGQTEFFPIRTLEHILASLCSRCTDRFKAFEKIKAAVHQLEYPVDGNGTPLRDLFGVESRSESRDPNSNSIEFLSSTPINYPFLRLAAVLAMPPGETSKEARETVEQRVSKWALKKLGAQSARVLGVHWLCNGETGKIFKPDNCEEYGKRWKGWKPLCF